MMRRVTALWLALAFGLLGLAVTAGPATAAPGDTACQRYQVLRQGEQRTAAGDIFIDRLALAYAEYHCQQHYTVDDAVTVKLSAGPSYHYRSQPDHCGPIQTKPVDSPDPNVQRQQAECIADWYHLVSYTLSTPAKCRQFAGPFTPKPLPAECKTAAASAAAVPASPARSYSADPVAVHRPPPAWWTSKPAIISGVAILVIALLLAAAYFGSRSGGGGSQTGTGRHYHQP